MDICYDEYNYHDSLQAQLELELFLKLHQVVTLKGRGPDNVAASFPSTKKLSVVKLLTISICKYFLLFHL